MVTEEGGEQDRDRRGGRGGDPSPSTGHLVPLPLGLPDAPVTVVALPPPCDGT